MALSQHSDSVLLAQSPAHVGYPKSTVNDATQPIACVNNDTPLGLTTTWFPHNGVSTPVSLGVHLQRDPDGEFVGVTNSVLKLRVDSGPGASGGSLMFWSGNIPYHIGVLSGHVPNLTGPAWAGGPKTSTIYDFVVINAN